MGDEIIEMTMVTGITVMTGIPRSTGMTRVTGMTRRTGMTIGNWGHGMTGVTWMIRMT